MPSSIPTLLCNLVFSISINKKMGKVFYDYNVLKILFEIFCILQDEYVKAYYAALLTRQREQQAHDDNQQQMSNAVTSNGVSTLR